MILDEDEVFLVSLRDYIYCVFFFGYGRIKVIVNKYLVINFIVIVILNKVGVFFVGFY